MCYSFAYILQNIVATLGEPEVTQTSHIPLLNELLSCTEAIVQTAGPLCHQHSEAIFTILLRLQASSAGQQVLIEKVKNYFILVPVYIV